MSDLLIWLDANPERYRWFVCLVLFIVSFCALRPLLRKPEDRDQVKSDWIWGWAIFAVLFIGRWPSFFIPFELNLDESQLIAGGHSLRSDPVFWRSVDGTTSGPLDFYALIPAGSLIGSDGFLSARLTALALITSALLMVHQAGARIFGRTAARIGGLSTVFLEAFTDHTDFLHYSNELVSVTLIAGAFYLGILLLSSKAPDYPKRIFLGLLLGAVPFAKLQAGPIAAAVGLTFIGLDLLSSQPRPLVLRRWLALTAGALAPLAFVIILALSTDEWPNVVIPYFFNNLFYTGANHSSLQETALLLFRSTAHQGALIRAWLGGGALLLLVLLARGSWAVETRRFILAASVMLFASALCIVTPHRAYPHYLQLLMVPWALMLCSATAVALKIYDNGEFGGRKIIVLAGMMAGCGLIIHDCMGATHPVIGHLNAGLNPPQGAVAQTVLQYSRPGEKLGIWGWMPRYYVETNRPMATREGNIAFEISPGPHQQFFRKRYLADLVKCSPSVFIDAARDQKSVLLNWLSVAHDENFPELADFIRTHYTLITEREGSRIYVRNDRVNSVTPGIAKPAAFKKAPATKPLDLC